MLCNMPTYVLVPESFVHNPKLLSLLCYFGPTHCFSLEALNSQIEKGRGPKIFARSARELQHLPPLNPGYATGPSLTSFLVEVALLLKRTWLCLGVNYGRLDGRRLD